LIARYGGEEIVAVLPATGRRDRAQHLRAHRDGFSEYPACQPHGPVRPKPAERAGERTGKKRLRPARPFLAGENARRTPAATD